MPIKQNNRSLTMLRENWDVLDPDCDTYQTPLKSYSSMDSPAKIFLQFEIPVDVRTAAMLPMWSLGHSGSQRRDVPWDTVSTSLLWEVRASVCHACITLNRGPIRIFVLQSRISCTVCSRTLFRHELSASEASREDQFFQVCIGVHQGDLII